MNRSPSSMAPGDWDSRLSATIRESLKASPIAQRACRLVAHAGDGVLCLAILGGLAWLAPELRPIVLRVLVAVLLAAGLVALGKVIVQRPRPFADESHRWSSLGKHDRHAFPSGHAARTATIAVTAWLASPLLGLLLSAWSLAVSACRVALGAHYVGDVVAGWLIGIVAAVIVQVAA